MTHQATPAEEIVDKIATGLPGIAIAAHAVGLEDHRRMLHENARRVREGFLWQAKQAGEQAGQPDSVMSDKDVDDMGNIVITGDISLKDGADAERMLRGLHGQQAKDPQQPVSSPQPAEPSPLKTAALASLMTLASGGLGAAAYHFLNNEPPQQAPPTTTTTIMDTMRYDVEKWIPTEGQ